MSSLKVQLTANTWAKITNGESTGSIMHNSGNPVSYVQSELEPPVIAPGATIAQATIAGESFPYFSVISGEFIWAISTAGDAVITVTAGE